MLFLRTTTVMGMKTKHRLVQKAKKETLNEKCSYRVRGVDGSAQSILL